MRFLVFPIAVMAACLSFPASAETTAPVSAILSAALANYVRPAYTALSQETGQLANAAKVLCQEPSSAHLTATHSAFKSTVMAWSKVEWFRTGAAMSDNRIERMLYFPDRKGTGLKQVQRALADKDTSVISSETLSSKSVAMQGLGAAEFLLFGADFEQLATPSGSHRCEYVLASAKTMSAVANQLKSGWLEDGTTAQFWQKPAADNPYFRSDTEALNVLIGTVIHGLEAVRDMRIAAFLGKTEESDKPKSAAFWRSKATFASLAANLEGLEQLYVQSKLAGVLPARNADLVRTIDFDFKQAIRAAKVLDVPVADVLADRELRAKAAYLKLTVQILIDHFNMEFAPAAGLAAGFSFGDGD
jgi:uncharacterized protein